MIKRLIIDADVCIKLGTSEKYCFLQELLPCLSEKSFIHQYVYDEILTPASAKTQLNWLIGSGFLDVIDSNDLSVLEKTIYEAAYNLLSRVMANPGKPRQNHGEISSLAMAKALSIPVFFTDERNLQPIIDANLNTGIDNIKCIRIIDVIHSIQRGKIGGFYRKQAKAMWVLSGKPKEVFDSKVWPTGQ